MVTGAAGAGQRVCELAAADPTSRRVIALDRRPLKPRSPAGIERHQVDLATTDLKPLFEGADVVVHLAQSRRPGAGRPAQPRSPATGASPTRCSTPPPPSAPTTSCCSRAPPPTARGPTTRCRSPRTRRCGRTRAWRWRRRRRRWSGPRRTGVTTTPAPRSPSCGPPSPSRPEPTAGWRRRWPGRPLSRSPRTSRPPSSSTSPTSPPPSTSPAGPASTALATWRPTAGSAGDTVRGSSPGGAPRLRLPERLAIRVAGLRWRWGMAPTPPELLPVHRAPVGGRQRPPQGRRLGAGVLQRGGLRRPATGPARGPRSARGAARSWPSAPPPRRWSAPWSASWRWSAAAVAALASPPPNSRRLAHECVRFVASLAREVTVRRLSAHGRSPRVTSASPCSPSRQ